MIHTRNLRKRLGRHDVLQGLDLEIPAGQRVALIGSNGAGKTTLIRCLLGEYTREGDVRLVGRDPRRFRTEVLRHVGFVPQLPPPLKMPVGQLIRYVASLCEADSGHIVEVATRLGFDAEPEILKAAMLGEPTDPKAVWPYCNAITEAEFYALWETHEADPRMAATHVARDVSETPTRPPKRRDR